MWWTASCSCSQEIFNNRLHFKAKGEYTVLLCVFVCVWMLLHIWVCGYWNYVHLAVCRWKYCTNTSTQQHSLPLRTNLCVYSSTAQIIIITHSVILLCPVRVLWSNIPTLHTQSWFMCKFPFSRCILMEALHSFFVFWHSVPQLPFCYLPFGLDPAAQISFT